MINYLELILMEIINIL